MLDTVHVESQGSHWFFDQTARTYIRTPKGEGPRWSPPGRDWGGPGAPECVRDLQPHPYLHWWLNDIDQLRIVVPGNHHGIRTPPGALVRSGARSVSAVSSDDEWLEWMISHLPDANPDALQADK